MSKEQEKKRNKRMLAVASVALAVTLVIGSVVMSAASGFTDYKPPPRFDVNWGDWITQGGAPLDGPGPGAIATWVQDYPYRTILFGGAPTSNSSSKQKHDGQIIAIYSKKPIIDLFEFSYNTSKQYPTRYGYIRASYKKDDPLLYKNYYENGNHSTVEIMYTTTQGIPDGPLTLRPREWANFTGNTLPSNNNAYIDFDFWYFCDHCWPAQVEIEGIRHLTQVPYPYIMHCDPAGNNPSSSSAVSSTPGSSSGGGSSSGSSSGGGNSGGSSSGGSSSSGSSSVDDSSYLEDYWDDYYPDSGGKPPSGGTTGQGTIGDEGETGGTWKLPGWNDPDVTGEASGFKRLEPGTYDWGYNELKPDGEQGYYDFGAGGVSRGLYDFMGGWLW